MTRPVDVLGELSVSGEGGVQLQVEGRGDSISVALPSLRVGRSLARQAAGRSRRQTLITRLQAGLRRADLTLQINLAGRPIARLAPRSKPTLLSRLLGLGAIELQPVGLLLAVFRRQGSVP